MELKLVNEGRRAGYAAGRLSEFAARCRKGGLAVTPQRLAIIKALLTFRGTSPRRYGFRAGSPRASAYLTRHRASHAGDAVRDWRGA